MFSQQIEELKESYQEKLENTFEMYKEAIKEHAYQSARSSLEEEILAEQRKVEVGAAFTSRSGLRTSWPAAPDLWRQKLLPEAKLQKVSRVSVCDLQICSAGSHTEIIRDGGFRRLRQGGEDPPHRGPVLPNTANRSNRRSVKDPNSLTWLTSGGASKQLFFSLS